MVLRMGTEKPVSRWRIPGSYEKGTTLFTALAGKQSLVEGWNRQFRGADEGSIITSRVSRKLKLGPGKGGDLHGSPGWKERSDAPVYGIRNPKTGRKNPQDVELLVCTKK